MRNYLPTFADLIDRLSIVTLKSIKLSEHKEEYEKEAQLIILDLNEIGKEKGLNISGQMIRAILMIMLSNVTIWENESKARLGTDDQNHLLRFTHSVNGVRNLAKNVISNEIGERKDLKTDCLAADLCKQQGYNFAGIFYESGTAYTV
jgi:hypothetical protein